MSDEYRSVDDDGYIAPLPDESSDQVGQAEMIVAPVAAEASAVDEQHIAERAAAAEAPTRHALVPRPGGRLDIPPGPAGPQQRQPRQWRHEQTHILGITTVMVATGTLVGVRYGGLYGSVAGGLYGGAAVNAFRAIKLTVQARGDEELRREALLSATYAIVVGGLATWLAWHGRKEMKHASK